MQDFTAPFPYQTEPEIRRRLTDEQLMASPMDMYLYALALRDQLPENLHQAMIMWSFDPKQNEYVQMYLEWVASCEKRKTAKERWDKIFARNDKIIKYLMIALGAMLSILYIRVLTK